jgi:hypothetical protein
MTSNQESVSDRRNSMDRFMKLVPPAVGGVVMVVMMTIVDAQRDGLVQASEWVQVVIQGATVAIVWATANVPQFDKAKSFVAAVMVVLNLLVSYITDGVSGTEWINLAIAFLGAVGVYAVPNAPLRSAPVRGTL